MRVCILDSCGDFTYSLSDAVKPFCKEIITVEAYTPNRNIFKDISDYDPTHIFLSYNTVSSKLSEITKDIIYSGNYNIMGIGKGFFTLAGLFGAKLIDCDVTYPGIAENIYLANASPVFLGIKPVIKAGVYSCGMLERKLFPDNLQVVAECEKGSVMGYKHREYNIYAINFYPHSVMTEQGLKILQNFIEIPRLEA